MPYDPRPLGPTQDGHDELPVLIGAGARPGEGESLLILGRPAGGRVRVREWADGAWADPPREREVGVDAVLAEVEAAQRAGRRLNQSVDAVRLWLRGVTG